MHELIPFLGIAIVLVAIPGPAVTLTMKNALMRGGGSAMTTAFGVMLGDLVWVVASVAGVTAILVASAPAFLALKLVGAAYLLYMGIRLLLGRMQFEPALDEQPARSKVSNVKAFREGVVCELSNPKTLLVFTSVIPQFLPASHGVGDAVMLGLAFAIVGFTSLAFYALAFSQTRRVVDHSRLKEVLMRGCGGILIAFGIAVVGETS